MLKITNLGTFQHRNLLESAILEAVIKFNTTASKWSFCDRFSPFRYQKCLIINV